MSRWLRQSTSVDLPIGPFVDATDGATAETGLTITQPDIRLKKNNAAWAQKNAAQTLSHEENGYYEVTLDATDTNTLGLLRVAVHEAGALPVWEDFLVVPPNVWDSFFGADLLHIDARQWMGSSLVVPTVTGVPEVDVTHLAADAQSATDLKDFVDAGYDPSSNKVQGVVLTDTVTTYTGNTPQTGDAFTRLGAAGAGLTAVPWNASWDAEVQSEVTDALAPLLATLLFGTVDDGTPAANDFNGATALSSTNDFYNGSVLAFTSGALQGVARQISDYVGATRTLQFTGTGEQADAPFPTAPANGDSFVIVGRIGT